MGGGWGVSLGRTGSGRGIFGRISARFPLSKRNGSLEGVVDLSVLALVQDQAEEYEGLGSSDIPAIPLPISLTCTLEMLI